MKPTMKKTPLGELYAEGKIGADSYLAGRVFAEDCAPRGSGASADALTRWSLYDVPADRRFESYDAKLERLNEYVPDDSPSAAITKQRNRLVAAGLLDQVTGGDDSEPEYDPFEDFEITLTARRWYGNHLSQNELVLLERFLLQELPARRCVGWGSAITAEQIIVKALDKLLEIQEQHNRRYHGRRSEIGARNAPATISSAQLVLDGMTEAAIIGQPIEPPPTPITRSEARALGLKTYFTGEPCARGHVSPRGVANHACLECERIRDAERYASGKNPIRV